MRTEGDIGFAAPCIPVRDFGKIRAMHRFQRWRDLIQAAGNASAIQGVMKDYVSSLPDAVISTLPEECQRALNETDVQSAAVTLLHCELTYKGDPAIQELLHEIAHTFAVASMRITWFSRGPLAPTDA
jgi:hypothetical protein